MINVTKSFLPPIETYIGFISGLWESRWLTNGGPLVKELESRLRGYLGVSFLQLTTNGTIAIQLALKALGIRRKVITTPFSYVATAGSILWEGCTPVFADIDRRTLCIDPSTIEQLIDSETEAVLATHVFGYPCDVNALGELGRRRSIKIIYDGAHAFGSCYRGRALLDYGDVSTCSFHATKLFHTVEGGCVIAHEEGLDREVSLKKSFGHAGDDYFTLGINAKNSEFHAAMGLSILPYMREIIRERKSICEAYDEGLRGLHLERPLLPDGLDYNYAYYPVILESKSALRHLIAALREKDVFPRRYFWPSLNTIPYFKGGACPVSENVAERILCLPVYNGLTKGDQGKVLETIVSSRADL